MRLGKSNLSAVEKITIVLMNLLRQYDVGLETLSDYLESQALWQQAYETKVDAHFQLYLSYIAYLKATGKLYDESK